MGGNGVNGNYAVKGVAGQARPRRPEIGAAGRRSPTMKLESVPEADSRLKAPVNFVQGPKSP